jgi:hypothetical protein
MHGDCSALFQVLISLSLVNDFWWMQKFKPIITLTYSSTHTIITTIQLELSKFMKMLFFL